ncbi:hypothetical protein FHS95_003099 [Sphingomonas naasensis]|uniref:Uncharacterized protein n=1 Tax=Sphingomonas naasensis TaxID=1344951 RepID=A0A4V3QW84_9SPHN|nr:hypothetical protein [Sphingomonas naasensis]NIJ21396.1 hypothetical protein [Sphingomonas naasensis]TGX41642.1 hypothetical protein E5A74_13615 [Sphingomonas naasensis]
MSKFNERLFARLDTAAERTGVPAMACGKQSRRRLRWLPLVPLALASGSLLTGLIRADLANMGFALITLSYTLAVVLPIFGPLKPWGTPERVDEFDRALRGRAMLAGYATVSVAALIGMWLILGLAVIGDWPRERILWQLAGLPFYLLTLHLVVPTLHASWAIRPVEDD